MLSLPSLEADRLVGLEDLPVTALAASPDGSRIVSGGDFRDLKVTPAGSKAGSCQVWELGVGLQGRIVSAGGERAAASRACVSGGSAVAILID